MIFTTKTEYGLKALAILAQNKKNESLSLADIARSTGLSLSYLEQLFAKLRRAGIIESVKGSDGGYHLARPAGKISLKEIVDALEGKTAVNACMTGSHSCCSGHCLTRKVWVEIQRDLEKTLNKYKLKDII